MKSTIVVIAGLLSLISSIAIAEPLASASCKSTPALEGTWKAATMEYKLTFHGCTLTQDHGEYAVTSNFTVQTLENGRLWIEFTATAVSNPVYAPYIGRKENMLVSTKGSSITLWGVADETSTTFTKQ